MGVYLPLQHPFIVDLDVDVEQLTIMRLYANSDPGVSPVLVMSCLVLSVTGWYPCGAKVSF